MDTASNYPNTLVALSPVPVRSAPDPASEMVTELIAGETLVPLDPLEERGGWLRVVVPGHPSSLDERGYPGWVSPEAPLIPANGGGPDLIVVRPNRAGLPLGTLLRTRDENAVHPAGDALDLDDGDTTRVGVSYQLFATSLACSLLGLPYRWGGTDSTTGMDCSGLVYRVMQLLGTQIPRDSGDQFERAPLRSEAGWEEARPGDLVFFGETSVTHVGFYLGDNDYVSAHGGSHTGCVVVRAMTDDPYRGFARYERI